MKRYALISVFLMVLGLSASAYALDAPHSDMNNITCYSCHYTTSAPPWWSTSYTPANIDDTPYNKLCLECHKQTGGGPYTPTSAIKMETHSDYVISGQTSQNWSMECRTCHNPHSQRQFAIYRNTDPASVYLAKGTIGTISYDNGTNQTTFTYTLTSQKTGWDYTRWPAKTSAYRGAIMYPNHTIISLNYPVVSATNTSVTVKGNATAGTAATYIKPGSTFGITYGQLINERINVGGTYTTVKFFGNEANTAGTFAYNNNPGGNDTVIDGVCQVCHAAATHTFWKADGTGANHNNDKRCSLCHQHGDGGFKASCDMCHGYPPIVGNPPGPLGGPDGLASPATGSTTAGAHAYHATTKGYGCDTCHYNSAGTGSTHFNESQPRITLGFYLFSGSVQGGSYTGQATATYNTTSTTPATTVSNPGTGAMTCAIYCHGSTMAPNGATVAAPVWNAATGAYSCATSPNGACHGASSANPPVRGSHQKHTMSFSSFGRQMACTVCHSGYTPNHVNGSVNWAFDTATYSWLTGGQYNSLTTGSKTPVPSTEYNSCTNLYCHSAVQKADGTALTGAAGEYSNPQWGDSSTGACGTCHKLSAIGLFGHTSSSGTIGSGSHTRHLAYSFNASSNTYKCALCHKLNAAGTVNDCSACHAAEMDMHVNHEVTVGFETSFIGSATYNGTPAPGDGFSSSTCDNTYCHSKGTGGTSQSGDVRPITTNTTPTWGSGSLTCISCHGNEPGNDGTGRPYYASGAPKANSHEAHAGYLCNYCHVNTSSDGTTITSTANHVNRAYNVNGGAGATFTYAYAFAGGSCSSISCHFNSGATWGGAVSCGGCHAAPPTTGAHTVHTGALNSTTSVYGNDGRSPSAGAYGFNCGNCHPLALSSHGNGTVEVELYNASAAGFKARNPVTAARSGSGLTTVCQNVYCHSSGAASPAYVNTPQWGQTFTGLGVDACGQCHGNSPAGASHAAHVVGIHYDTIYTGTTGLTTAGTAVTNSHGLATASTTINCHICHNATVTSSANDRNANCSAASCHDAAPRLKGNAAIASKTNHINGQPDIQFVATNVLSKAQIRDDISTVSELNNNWARTASSYKTGATQYDTAKNALNTATMWNSGTKACSNISCHNGNAATWGSSTITCNSCHTMLPR